MHFSFLAASAEQIISHRIFEVIQYLFESREGKCFSIIILQENSHLKTLLKMSSNNYALLIMVKNSEIKTKQIIDDGQKEMISK